MIEKQQIKKKTFRFNTIYILESLRPGDTLTGSSVYTDIIRRWCDKLGHTNALLMPITDQKQFYESLDSINTSIEEHGIYPYIHIETHGSTEGIQLGNYDIIIWEDLIGRLRKINISSKNNLFVSLASCNSAHFIRAIGNELTERAPCLGLVGTMKKIKPADLEISFQEFFETLLRTDDYNEAVDALNNAIDRDDLFGYITSYALFDHLHKKHLNPRVQNKMAKDAEKQFRTRLKHLTSARIRFEIKRWQLTQQPEEIQTIRRYFLFESDRKSQGISKYMKTLYSV